MRVGMMRERGGGWIDGVHDYGCCLSVVLDGGWSDDLSFLDDLDGNIDGDMVVDADDAGGGSKETEELGKGNVWEFGSVRGWVGF